MAIQVRGLGGRSGGLNTSREQHVLLFDAWDDTGRWNVDFEDMQNNVAAFAPPTYLGLSPTDINYDEGEDTGHYVWEITYGSSEPAESLLRIGWDTTGGTVRARASRSTTSYPTSGRTAPDYKHSIEVSDGKAEGIDVVIPALKLVFTYKWPKGVMSITDAKIHAGITGSVNDASFYGFAAGELLFLGSTAEVDPTTPTSVQYTFAASANATGISIGSWITGIAKEGHQHLWIAFEDDDDTSAKKVVTRPLAAYIETVYLAQSFGVLGLGS